METFPAHEVLEQASASFEIAFDSLRRVSDVTVALTIQKSGEEFFCQGTVDARLNVECSRCLGEYETEISSEVDFIVCPAGQHDGDPADAVDDEDYVYLQGSDLRADITDIVRQAIILSISMKPLCRSDCQGLCPQCGVNRNEAQCQCQVEEVDGRWEGLKKFLDSTSNEARG